MGTTEQKKKKRRPKKKKKKGQEDEDDDGAAGDGYIDDDGTSAAYGHGDGYVGESAGGQNIQLDDSLELEKRISPHDNHEYTFSEFYERHAQFHSREDIERYWFEECQPSAQRRVMAVQDSLAELVRQLQGQAGLASLGNWADELGQLEQNPAFSMLSQLGNLGAEGG